MLGTGWCILHSTLLVSFNCHQMCPSYFWLQIRNVWFQCLLRNITNVSSSKFSRPGWLPIHPVLFKCIQITCSTCRFFFVNRFLEIYIQSSVFNCFWPNFFFGKIFASVSVSRSENSLTFLCLFSLFNLVKLITMRLI